MKISYSMLRFRIIATGNQRTLYDPRYVRLMNFVQMAVRWALWACSSFGKP